MMPTISDMRPAYQGRVPEYRAHVVRAHRMRPRNCCRVSERGSDLIKSESSGTVIFEAGRLTNNERPEERGENHKADDNHAKAASLFRNSLRQNLSTEKYRATIWPFTLYAHRLPRRLFRRCVYDVALRGRARRLRRHAERRNRRFGALSFVLLEISLVLHSFNTGSRVNVGVGDVYQKLRAK